jgi:uncharacterized membrane protein (DUF2068 family)
MSTDAKATVAAVPDPTQEAPLKRSPALLVIILFKMIKGALFLTFAIVLYCQASHDLPQEWQDLLQKPVVEHIFERLRIHPENKFFQHIAEQIENVTERQIRVTALGTLLFSLFPLVEGIGMLYRAGWAGWLAIGESAFFVPIEMYELARRFSLYMLLVMIVNILIVSYLYANRQAFFHHHHPARTA